MHIHERVLKLALTTGRILLTNGAETYRVEDTVKRMIESRGMKHVNVFVIPTGIFVSTFDKDQNFSLLERVNPSGIDLEVIDRTNDLSRKFTSSDMTIDHAEQALNNILKTPTYGNWMRYFFSGMAGGFFVFLFGGNFNEFIIAYFASFLTVIIYEKLTHYELNFFIKNILSGSFVALTGLLFIKLATLCQLNAHLNYMIIGPLMTLVPGVTLTNGIRDLISGELLSGSAKIMEALFFAIALAFGVGIVLQLGVNWLN